MADQIAYLEAVVGADVTAFRREMAGVRNDVGLLSETMGGLGAVGRAATLAITTPLLIAGGAAVSAASDFEASMRNINSIANLSESNFSDLSDSVLNYGETTRAGATKTADALYTIYSAGLTGKTAMDLLHTSTNTAEAGLSDMTVTTNALVAMFQAFGGAELPANEQLAVMQHESDSLTETVQIGVGTMQQFASALAQAYPAAHALGISFDEVNASAAFLTQRGFSAARASVSLNSAMSELIKPSTAMSEMFTKLGVQSGTDLIAKFGGLEGALHAIIGALDPSIDKTSQLGQLFLNIQAGRAINTIATDFNAFSGSLNSFTAAEDGATDRAHAQQMESFASILDHLQSAVQGIAITVGNDFLPVLKPLVQGLTDFALQIATADPQVIQFALGLAAVVAAAGPLLWLIGSLTNPIALVIEGLGLLAAAFVTDFGGIRDKIKSLVSDIFGDIGGTNSAVHLLLDALFPPDAQTQVDAYLPLVAPTVTIQADQYIRVTVPSDGNVFGAWMSSPEAQAYFSFADFEAQLKSTGVKPAELKAGDFLVVDKNFGADAAAGATTAINTGLSAITDVINAVGVAVHPLTVKVQPHITLADRLTNAKDLVVELLDNMLPGMLENAVKWFDEHVGEGLANIGKLFEFGAFKGGKTPIYDAFNDLLSGDITKAINDAFPTLGTTLQGAVEGFGTSIEKALPKITAGIKAVLDGAKDFLLTTGIPTLARAAGDLGGHLASALYDAVSLAVNFFSGGDANKVAGDVGGYVKNSIWPQIQAGFNDGIAGSSLQTQGVPAIKTALEGIGKILDGIDITFISDSFSNLSDSVKQFTSTMNGVNWDGVSKFLQMGLAISAGLAVLTIGNVLNVVAAILPPIATAISDIADAFNQAKSGDIGGAIRSVALGVVQLGSAFLQIPATVIDKTLEFLNNVLHLNIQIPDLAGTVRKWAADITNALNGVNVAADIKPKISVSGDDVTLDIKGFTGTGKQLADQVYEQLQTEGFDTRMSDYIHDYIMNNPPTADVDTLTLHVSPTAMINADAHNGMHLPVVTVTVDTVHVVPAAVSFDLNAAAMNFHADVSAAQTPLNIPALVLPDDAIKKHFETEAQKGAQAASDIIIGSFAAGGITDPAIILNTFLIPNEQNFNTYLGPNSNVAKTITGFVTTVAVGTGASALAFGLLAVATGVSGGLMVKSLTGTQTSLSSVLGKIKSGVDGVTGSLLAMAAAAASALALASAAGGVKLGGARAEGGDVEEGSTYLVGENGPELWTAPGSGSIIPTNALMGSARDSMHSGNTVVHQNVTINAPANLQQLLAEARRQGIKLGDY